MVERKEEREAERGLNSPTRVQKGPSLHKARKAEKIVPDDSFETRRKQGNK